MQNLIERRKALSPEEINEKLLKNPAYLPTHSEIKFALPDNKRWRDFLHTYDEHYNELFYEFWNQEYIQAFASYLEKRIIHYQCNQDNPITILELGAGNGRLSYFLQSLLEDRCKGKFKFVATDTGKWTIEPAFPVKAVESNKQALEDEKPIIVICSWIPHGEDWTADIRATQSVQEYLLIGEPEGGACGDSWKTWGVIYTEGGPIERPDNAPYKFDGFEQVVLNDLRKKQICRTDKYPDKTHFSATVSFRRKG